MPETLLLYEPAIRSSAIAASIWGNKRIRATVYFATHVTYLDVRNMLFIRSEACRPHIAASQ